ncbi:MAG: hypothetical protein ABFR75_12640 [Acidobacteriota bacterium]
MINKNKIFKFTMIVILTALFSLNLSFCSKETKPGAEVEKKTIVKKKDQVEQTMEMQKGKLCSDCHDGIDDGEITMPESKKKEVSSK